METNDIFTAVRVNTRMVKDSGGRTCCAIVRCEGLGDLDGRLRGVLRNGRSVAALLAGDASLAAQAARECPVVDYSHGRGEGERTAFRDTLDIARDNLEQRTALYAHKPNYQNMRKVREAIASERGAVRDYMASLRNGK